MTLTIELSPNEEARLQAAAQHEGMEPAELARQLIANLPPAPTARPANGHMEAQTERDPELVARVRSLRGKFTHTVQGEGLASEELHRERERDREKEEAFIREHNR